MFRTTRSGSAFSPWGGSVEPPLHAPATFNVQKRIEDAMGRGDHVHYVLGASEGHSESPPDPLEDEDHVVTGGLTAEDVTEPPPTEPIVLPPSLVIETARPRRYCRGRIGPRPHLSSDTGIRSGHDTPAMTASIVGPPSGVGGSEKVPSKRPAEHDDDFDTTISKQDFHNKRRKNAARNARRKASGGQGGMNRPVKEVALRLGAPRAIMSLQDVGIAGLLKPDTAPELNNPQPPICTAFSLDMGNVRVASTAFQGLLYRPSQAERNARDRAFYESKGFQYVPWDGRSVVAVLDRDGRPIVVLQGYPGERDEWMREVNDVLSQVCEEVRGSYRFKKCVNKRVADNFKAINFGISFGGGQQRVGRLAQGSHTNYAIVERLTKHPALLRVANFSNAGLQMFWPKIYNFYDKILAGVLARDGTLSRNFLNNVFACATLNVGPRTVTAPHYDHLNIPFGLCAITALGRFNPKTGGQLVLEELKMIIEFPAGSTVEILSAIVKHSNLGIGDDEVRYSFTQYTAGGLFRWWECGYRAYKTFAAMGMRFKRTGMERWQWGVGLLGTWEDIKHLWVPRPKGAQSS